MDQNKTGSQTHLTSGSLSGTNSDTTQSKYYVTDVKILTGNEVKVLIIYHVHHIIHNRPRLKGTTLIFTVYLREKTSTMINFTCV